MQDYINKHVAAHKEFRKIISASSYGTNDIIYTIPVDGTYEIGGMFFSPLKKGDVIRLKYFLNPTSDSASDLLKG